jgi:multiple sugar transport system permease protein
MLDASRGEGRPPLPTFSPLQRRLLGWRRNRAYVGGLIPAAVLLALFFIAPAAWAIRASFTNRALLGIDARNPRWVGLDNYRRLFDDPDLIVVLKNSLIFVVGSALIGQFLLGLGLALLLDFGEQRGYRMTSLVYGTVLLAWVNPTLIAGFLWVAMFDYYYGSLNKALEFLGFEPVSWLGSSPMLAIIVVNIWRGTAFVMIIFLGGLKTIPSQIYEAARIDGAGPWQRFWDHTLPNLRHIATITLLSITISTLGAFILIETLTGGGPGIQTETLSLYAYHTAFRSYEIGYGSTIAVLMLSINLIASVFYLRLARPRV